MMAWGTAEKAKIQWAWWKVAPFALLVGLPGLAPAVWTLMVLNAAGTPGDPINNAGGTSALKLLKAVEHRHDGFQIE